MTKNSLVDLKLKDGRTFPKGTPFVIAFVREENDGVHYMLVRPLDGSDPFKTKNFHKFFKAPSVHTMQKWSFDGIAKSVSGLRVEPDGHGPDGSPSWLLALGMI